MTYSSDINITDIFSIIWRRKILFAIVFGVVLLTVLQVSLILPPKYRAETKIIVQNETGLYPGDIVPVTLDDFYYMTTQKEIILSKAVVNNAFKEMQDKGITVEKDFKPGKSISSSFLMNSNILSVTVDYRDPEFSKELANQITHAFINYHVDEKKMMIDRSLSILSSETDALENDIAKIEERLKSFYDKGRMDFYNVQVPYFIDSIIKTERDDLSAEVNIERFQKELDNTKAALKDDLVKDVLPFTPRGQGEEPISLLDTNTSMQDFKSRITGLKSELSNLLIEYTDEYPGIKSIKDQISLLENNFNNEIKKILDVHANYYKGYINFLEKQKESNKISLDEYKAAFNKISEDIKNSAYNEIEYNILANTYEIKQDIYSVFLKKKKSLEVLKQEISNNKIPNIRILEESSLPLRKVFPNLPLNLLMGIFFGFFVALAGAIIMERGYDKNEGDKGVRSFSENGNRSMSRVDRNIKVTYSLKNDASRIQHYGITRDLSASGARVEIDSALSKGAQINLRIYINDDCIIEALGEIVWIVSRSEKSGIYEAGVHFVRIESSEREKLINYLYEEDHIRTAA